MLERKRSVNHMILYPAIDLVGGKAVRLYKGDYAQMTVYSEDPVSVAKDFQKAGARRMHLVDLEAAKSGIPANAETIRSIAEQTDLFLEVGGGIRNMEILETYLSLGVDLKDGFVAIKGWTETSELTAEDFFSRMEQLGVKTVICTDISRDGAMKGTNRALYKQLSGQFSIDLIASGGVSSMEDILALKEMGLHGAIIGKAYYTGAIDLKEALEAAR